MGLKAQTEHLNQNKQAASVAEGSFKHFFIKTLSK